MITVKDVARQAQVSPGTVSNTLTGKRPVSSAARSRVLQAVEELGYHPNVLARSLVNRRSETIAVVTSGIEYFGPSRTLAGIEQEAGALGYSLLLELIPSSDEAQAQLTLANIVARQVDGIIWAVPEIGANRAWVLPERLHKLPPIIFLSMARTNGVSLIAVDNRAGARLATQHLIDLGRHTIGFVGGPPDWWESRERRAGWEEVLRQAGLPCARTLAEDGDWSAASGERGFGCLRARQPNIDAVFAANDQMALGVLRAAHLAGCRVPEDLAVVGFDDIPESAFFWPPLTTVHQHLAAAGRLAVTELQRLIVARLAGAPAGEPSDITLQPELVVRESSTGRVRQQPPAGPIPERR